MTGCARSNQSIGLVNELAKDTTIDGVAKPDPCRTYEIIWGNVMLSIVFSETIIAPIYFFGFSILDPTDTIKPGCKVTI